MAIGPDGQAVVPLTGPNAISPTAVAQLRAYLIARTQAATPKLDPGGVPIGQQPDPRIVGPGVGNPLPGASPALIPYALGYAPNGGPPAGGLNVDPEHGFAHDPTYFGTFPPNPGRAAAFTLEHVRGQGDVAPGPAYPPDPHDAYRMLLQEIARQRGLALAV